MAVALGAYARRGLRPVDVTLRLRASAAALATSGVAAELEVRSVPGATALEGPRLAEPGGSRTAPYIRTGRRVVPRARSPERST